jgi:hypothetical protein
MLRDAPPMAFLNNLHRLQETCNSVRFGRLGSVLGYRDTTSAADEAVCMSSILDLDTRNIVTSDEPHERMMAMYDQCSLVPLGLLFLDGPKLQNEGFRWRIRNIVTSDEPHERMMAMYDQCSLVPLGLLFLDGPKLQNEGFRWAPATLLCMDFTNTISLEAHTTHRVTHPECGLYVASQGFLLDGTGCR